MIRSRRPAIQSALDATTARHGRLCPRQVLGVRIGFAGADALGLDVPRTDRRLLVLVETDGCFADAVEVATGCSLGHHTLRLEDVGKIAATFVDVPSGRAVRVAPRAGIRELAAEYAPHQTRRYYQQMDGYQAISDADLLSVAEVTLTFDVDALLGRPGVRTNCGVCHEEIVNGRELVVDGRPLCLSCANGGSYGASARGSYYTPTSTGRVASVAAPSAEQVELGNRLGMQV